MTRRLVGDYALILLFVVAVSWLMHLTDAEPALPHCRSPYQNERCEP